MIKWAANWERNGWVRNVNNKPEPLLNLDLIQELYQLTKKYYVSYVHVRSHQVEPSDHTSDKWFCWNGNNMADKLATAAMAKVRNAK
jgi:ribonuclease HI